MTIIKKIENRKKSATKSARIHKVCDYITHPEKAAYVGARGFICDSYEARKAEMVALAVDGIRSPNPVNHYVVSWQAGEIPTSDQVERVITDLLHEFGMSDHQCIYGLHTDTDNRHLHVVLNRVNPMTGRPVKINQGFDKKACHRLSDKIDRAHGWSRPPRLASFFIAEQLQQGILDESKVQLEMGGPVVSQGALDYELRTREKSAERLAHDDAAPVIRKAASWKELHENLHAIGATLERRGRGAVLRIGETFVKASQAGKDCGFQELQKRLGDFEPPSRRLKSLNQGRHRSEPAITSSPPGFRQYAAERRRFREQKKSNTLELRSAQAIEKKKLIESQKEHRTRELQGSWKGQGKMLNEKRSQLAAQHAAEKAELRDRQAHDRQELRQRFRAFPSFPDWQRGPVFDSSPTLVGPYDPPQKRNLPGYEARSAPRGTVNYFLSTGQLAFSDCGSAIRVIDTRNGDGVLGALLLSAQKWSITEVRGDLQFQSFCTTLGAGNGIRIANPTHPPQKELQGPKTELQAKEKSQVHRMTLDENKKDRTRTRGPGLEL
ncbi:MAG TPA: relaxase/mobilization nuclease domain-containing protein [Oligoflexus sp.]|uniref:relaxase/mobilization nuclease domain-containing protein n=1 Tax=Oligoflexus sp. TaxID=1971216 RepID=UPI002D7F6E46|nr:relaxase/mobilization nuclease domain-containing protein [Oligoflexus sp.]HET9239252.1 relaxase/mobilization nuclease domain-containing protein [Oligoflexus sp.]